MPTAAAILEPSGPLCRCGAPLGRSGRCPALCEPVPEPPPPYTGPALIGLSHVGRLAAPVRCT